jgi:hypothetical protein
MVRIDGRVYTRVHRAEGRYYTLAGDVVVERSLYRAERNGPVADSISLRTGALEGGWLPETATAMAHVLQQGPSRDAEQTAHRLGRLPYSRCSFERVGHALGALYGARKTEIDDALIVAVEIPKAAQAVSFGLDRVSLPMEEPRPRPVGRPRHDAPKRPLNGRLFGDPGWGHAARRRVFHGRVLSALGGLNGRVEADGGEGRLVIDGGAFVEMEDGQSVADPRRTSAGVQGQRAEGFRWARSALVERFSRYLSEPPMTYLTRWRLQLAAQSLVKTSRGVAEIAADIGCQSEAAFSRAFSREFGQPPGRYRSDHKSSRQTHVTSDTSV